MSRPVPPPAQRPLRRPVVRPPQARPELSDAAVVSRSWGMAFATLVSRLTGFARIVLLAAILGAALSSAFSVANQLPNLVAALVLEATFTAIFVPVLARAEQDDADGGAAFVRRLVTLATTLLLVTTLVSVAAAPLLVRLMLGRTPEVNEPLTTAFAYLLLPQVIFYGLSSVFMAILNTRNVFGPPAWAPVVNNVVAIATLGVYLAVPGPLSVDPVQMGNKKLLVLGIGTTLGVFAQTAVLLVAIRRQRISLRPLWGIDQRLKRFGAMAAAMVFYVLISQIGLVVTNQIASTAAASGPAIYYYTWLVLMLPFGMIGVTVLTVVMPRLSRNAAADNTPAVLADLSLATRLTMITLIPMVAFMTVGGTAIGSALFAYGHFGEVDASYLGGAIALSAFTLIPYALVLLQLRVFYAREQPWIPIVIIVVITTVKIIASLIAPHVTDNPDLVAGYLAFANGLGFLAGAIVGYFLLRNALRPRGGQLLGAAELRTILVTIAASLLAGLIAHVVDELMGMRRLTAFGGGAGSLLRLLVLVVVMAPILAAVMLRARVPEAVAALAAFRRWIGIGHAGPGPDGRPPIRPRTGVAARKAVRPDQLSRPEVVTYPEQRNSSTPEGYPVQEPIRRRPSEQLAGEGTGRGPGMTERSSDNASSKPVAKVEPPQQAADDFQPDIPPDLQVGTVAAPVPPKQSNGTAAADVDADDPLEFDAPREPAAHPSPSQDEVHLVPGASIARGRYRLLVFHGGAPRLQFWQALDTALDRQVALTFIDPDGTMAEDELREVLARTLRLSRIEQRGIARILDVVHTGRGGLVVAEWIRGGSLQEVADTAPSAVGAARAMQTLATAAEAAHHAGVALSIDHPSRVRVSIEGDVVLAFPATMPDATPEDDIRGIGAALYALLVNRWPLKENGARSGMAPAPRDAAGQPVEPSSMDRDIPFQISAAAAHAIHGDGGIRSAATLLNLLQQATAVADRTELLSPIAVSAPPPPPPGRFRAPTPQDAQQHLRRRRSVMVGVGVGVAIIAVALLVLASILSRMFGDVSGLDKDQLGLNAPSASSTPGGEPAAAGSTVKPVNATVFSPGGEADNPGDAGLAIDGNPATMWQTDTYHDAVPFPTFKSGVGLLLQLPKPTVVGAVTVDLASTGTKVQIRSSSTSTPGKLDATTALTQPTLLHPGHNTIPVKASSPTSHLLVWISTLGTTDGKSRADISEITVQAAS
ncbi:murein biosynthesis integral membrane protein MurJ [Mycobacterium fragae]|uniref:Murein biosynthesis protein MurJ n=1 Tax=Mycobacterium fragae TaxID=1260918 RepID=A0A1X1UM01_9MYCO|nr:murein biosynthesis integral membrane protein MurJ [Mycobacterium fragae]MCV7398611.1 murein biosynthesis integral membrane protein MurJ [Mycobacterium fragae]ORV57874.1 murein biosynthesis protein MurJ [Mycobacterium fragae]